MRLEVQSGDYQKTAEGISRTDAVKLGLRGGENFFRVDGAGSQTSGGLQIDLSDGPSGVYFTKLISGPQTETVGLIARINSN
jgi:hypothetical protein